MENQITNQLNWAQRTANLRKVMDCSCETLARQIGVSWLTVWNWENGKGQPKTQAVQNAFQALETLYFPTEKK